MTIADELKKLDELRRSGTLSSEEFELAKRRVLEASQDHHLAECLEGITLQNETSRLDREWELERERFMLTGEHGQRQIPNKVWSVFGGILFVVFGIFWIASASSMTTFDDRSTFHLLPWLGFLIIVVGVGMSIFMFVRAGQYEKAEAKYRRRRREIFSKQRRSSLNRSTVNPSEPDEIQR